MSVTEQIWQSNNLRKHLSLLTKKFVYSLSPLEAGMAVKQGLAVMSESPTEEPVQMALPTQSMEAATAGNNSSNSFSGTDSNIIIKSGSILHLLSGMRYQYSSTDNSSGSYYRWYRMPESK